VGGWAAINQPHMKAAIEALEKAKMELAMAEHNKGGHRTKTIMLVNQAIQQTELGIKAGEIK